MTFYFVELKKKDQSLCVDILCQLCHDAAPHLQTPMTEREIANGYRYVVKPYTANDHACFECGREPEKLAKKVSAA